MANRRWRWYVRLLVGLLLIPPLLWLLVVVVAPTGWAKGTGRRPPGVPERASRRPRRPVGPAAGRDSPHEPGDRLAAGHRRSLAEGRRRPPRYRAAPDRSGATSGRRGSTWTGSSCASSGARDGTVELADLIRPVPVPPTDRAPRRPRPTDHVAVQVHHATRDRARRTDPDAASSSRMSRARDIAKGPGPSSTSSGGASTAGRSGSPRNSTGPPRR